MVSDEAGEEALKVLDHVPCAEGEGRGVCEGTGEAAHGGEVGGIDVRVFEGARVKVVGGEKGFGCLDVVVYGPLACGWEGGGGGGGGGCVPGADDGRVGDGGPELVEGRVEASEGCDGIGADGLCGDGKLAFVFVPQADRGVGESDLRLDVVERVGEGRGEDEAEGYGGFGGGGPDATFVTVLGLPGCEGEVDPSHEVLPLDCDGGGFGLENDLFAEDFLDVGACEGFARIGGPVVA